MRPVEKIFFVSLNNVPVSILSPLDPIVAVLGTLAVEVEYLCKVYLCSDGKDIFAAKGATHDLLVFDRNMTCRDSGVASNYSATSKGVLAITGDLGFQKAG